MRISGTVYATGFLALFIVAGCASTGTSVATERSVELATTWAIELHVSGGFAGVRQRLSLTNGGELLVEDFKRGKKVTGLIAQQELAEIGGILEKINGAQQADKRARKSSRCADCFQYSLTLDIEGQYRAVGYDSMSVRHSPYAALISRLSSMLRQALAGANTR